MNPQAAARMPAAARISQRGFCNDSITPISSRTMPPTVISVPPFTQFLAFVPFFVFSETALLSVLSDGVPFSTPVHTSFRTAPHIEHISELAFSTSHLYIWESGAAFTFTLVPSAVLERVKESLLAADAFQTSTVFGEPWTASITLRTV